MGLALSPLILSGSVMGTTVMTPRQQMASGVDANDVVCNEGLVLIIRSTNGAAACVKPSSAQVLEERLWGTIATAESMEKGPPEINLDETIGMDANQTQDEGATKKVEIEEELTTKSEESIPTEQP